MSIQQNNHLIPSRATIITNYILQKIQTKPFLKRNLPYLLMAIGNIIIPLSWIYVNQTKVNAAKSCIIRGFTSLLVNYLICRYKNYPTNIKQKKTNKLLTIRNTLLCIYVVSIAIIQFLLPLPIVHTLASSGIAFTYITDYFVNGTKINKKQFISIIIAFIGILITISSRYIFHTISSTSKYQSQFKNYQTDDIFMLTLASIIFVFVRILWSFAVILTKQLKDMNIFQINFHRGIQSLIIGAVLYIFWQQYADKTNQDQSAKDIQHFYKSIIYSGLLVTVGQWFTTGALTLSKDSGNIIMFNFIPIGVGYILSIFRYHQTQDPIAFIGIILLILGVWYTVKNKEQKNQSL